MTNTPDSPEGTRVAIWKRLGGGALTISVVCHLVILLLAIVWVWKTIPAEPDKVVDFAPRAGGGGEKARQAVQKKRSASMATVSAARIASLDSISSIVLPEPGNQSGLTSLGVLGTGGLSGGLGGSGMGGGSGTGSGTGIGSGFGPAKLDAASVRFFDQEFTATRIAYVIDFSKSMKGKREELMRAELAKSVSKLQPTQDYQLIFFAGPAWVAGWDVRMEDGDREGTVTSDDHIVQQWSAINAGNWERSGKTQHAKWLRADKNNIRRSVSIVNESALVFGTYWKPALDLALDMDPPPDAIYFMTDGVTSSKVYETIDDISRTARRRKVTIHTIAMMEPAAADAMKTLARQTGGKFTMIREDGTPSVSKVDN